MKTAFIDTNVIDYCCKNAINGTGLAKALSQEGYSPIIGIYTTYELAHCFLTNVSEKAKAYFKIIKELNPIFYCRSAQLYEREVKKLIDGDSVDPFIDPSLQKELSKRIDNYCNGEFKNEHKNFIEERESYLKLNRENLWLPSGNYKRKGRSFNDYLVRILDLLKVDTQKREVIKIFLQVFVKIKLTDNDINKLVLNINLFPALCALIYSQLYWHFQTENNNATPRKDRFTDCFQVIEASYCSAFVSHDKELVEDVLVSNFNPDIVLLNIKELINDDH